jgi:hypothetical protein
MGSVAVLLITLPLAFAQAKPDPNKTAHEILADGSYQTELPLGSSAPPESGDSFARNRGSGEGQGDVGSISHAESPSSGELGFGRIVAYILAAFGIAALCAALGRAAVAWWISRSGRPARVAADPFTEASSKPKDLEDSAALAAAGRYSEAVHALLLEAIEVLRTVASTAPIHESLTSREIVGHCQRSAASRDALGGIVACVEVSHFGGAPLASSDFAHCKALYQRFCQELAVPA